jgi:phage terminase large subunit-like protein
MTVKPIEIAIRNLLRSGQIAIEPGVRRVRAKTSKKHRASPVAMMYRSGDIIHREEFPKLETQWTTWDPDNTKTSPDRIDAVVHAITDIGREHGVKIFDL